MLNRKELTITLLAAVILAFTTSMIKTPEAFWYSLISVVVIFALNILAKKISANYFDSGIEMNLWEIQRYGFKPQRKLRHPFPIGAFLPIVLAFFTFGYVKWMGSLVFDVKAKVHRAVKRHGLYTFSEMTENHIGYIAAAGIAVNLIAAVIGYLTGYSEFTRLSVWFALSNMIPISDLDGNKIYFGNKVLWAFLAAITLIGAGYALLLV